MITNDLTGKVTILNIFFLRVNILSHLCFIYFFGRVLCTKLGCPDMDDVPVFTESDSSFCVDITSTKDGKFITVNSNSRTSSEEGTYIYKCFPLSSIYIESILIKWDSSFVAFMTGLCNRCCQSIRWLAPNSWACLWHTVFFGASLWFLLYSYKCSFEWE